MKKKHPPSAPYKDAVIQRIRDDPEFAFEYLKVAIEEATDEEGQKVLLVALKHLAEARGIQNVAKSAGMPRESLYRALSAKGNPRLSTLQAVTAALGVRLTLAHMAN